VQIKSLFHAHVSSVFKRKKNFTLSTEGYKIQKVLQDGKHSQILLAFNQYEQFVVLKKLDSRYIRGELIENEILAGETLSKHPGIVKLYTHFIEEEYVYLVLEYVSGVDLFDYLQMSDFKALKETDVKGIFQQIVNIVAYIHKKGFVHRDLKLENVMISQSGKVKIIDFGLCAHAICNSTLNSFLGSVEYACPEILARKSYNACKSEVWSLGVLLFALLHGQFPFSAFDREKKFNVDLCFPAEVSVSAMAKDLILNMLVVDSEKRYNLKDVANHPWVHG